MFGINYESFEVALDLLTKLGSGALVARLDVKSAFRLLPKHPSDFKMFGFQVLGNVYFDMCFPLGCVRLALLSFNIFPNFNGGHFGNSR